MYSNPRWARRVLPLAWLACSLSLGAQPSLTTIEDTVFRADGQRFDGVVMIEWRSFLASDYSSIAAYSKNSRVIKGVLKVSLVPTTTASVGAYYIVKYSNNGRVLFTEYWAVSPSATSLKLKDVRLVGPPIAGAAVNSPAANTGPAQINDVAGLTEELAARPKKGLGFIPSRAAVINSNGDFDAAVGDPTDCLHVNGSTSPCSGSSSPGFVDGEIPAGTLSGANAVFTLANAPNPGNSLQLFRNGVLQKPGLDFNLSGNTITFQPGSYPQSGDLLIASYRIAGASGLTGGSEAGGALTGFFPAPSIAPGAIADQHISPNAGIAESKLALNFPTHSNANDPTADQKAALSGSAGNPSNSNRFVTDQDSRLTNSRPPTGHPLLGSSHYDTNPAAVSRGDLIVGVGTSPALWTRLPLGAPNRCLTSNGSDAVWNACLFTGFPAGAVPFIDASGSLAHNGSRFTWDNVLRRLGVGVASPTSTLTVYDSSVIDGSTTLEVRAGEGQSSAPLQRWKTLAGSDVARLEADGKFLAASVRAGASNGQAPWQQDGLPADPSTLREGDAWLNTTEMARKSFEAGQKHPSPQVICSIGGTGTSSLTMTSLGQCRIPASMVLPSDRFRIDYELSHEGTTTAFSYALSWGGVVLTARSASGSETMVFGRGDAIHRDSALYWGWQNWGTSLSVLAGGGNSSAPTGDIIVDVQGQMASTTTDTVTLRSLTIVRFPAQANP
ncbi:MAG: hypothetical protein IT165_01110 [Bryobacterales bacterium]|nr:hypothetical protein [Bryobacterales bacterium]